MRKKYSKKDDDVKLEVPKLEIPLFNIDKISINLKCKNSNQKKLLNLIDSNLITIAAGPAGTGKAQPLTSPILTPNGWVTMGSIEVGDRVISKDGKETIVTAVYPQGELDIWELTFSDGTKVECCSNHLWLTQTEKDRNNRKHIGYVDGKRIREVCKLEGSVKSTIEIVETLYTKRGRVNHTIPMVEPVQFTAKDVLIEPYLMGLLLGDGCLRGSSIKLTTSDIEIIESINSIFDNSDDNMTINHLSGYDYSITDTKVGYNMYREYLKELDLIDKYSYEKSIPDCYKFNSVENRIKLLNGLMDSDGTVSKNGLYTSFTSTSLKLVNDVREIVQSLGGITTDHKPKNTFYTYNNEKRKGKTSYTLTITMPSNINPFSLKRKHDIVVPKSRYSPTRYIVSAKLIGKKEAKCISIDNPSHLYITNDYVVTHNTYLVCAEALKLMKTDKRYKKIILVKSVTELEGESIGYLKGGLMEKMENYMMSFMDNFYKLIGEDNTTAMLNEGLIEVLPLAYIRGRSIDNSIIIVDEAQNISLKNMRSTLTRIGDDSKMIITGDTKQIDIKNKRLSSLDTVVTIFSGKPNIGTMEFQTKDIVRNPIVMMIEEEFDTWEENQPKNSIKV